ncbi:hypothetical protein JB92DRAFT_2040109 [Gautieria morchelliformis]|nr:hypothetical protein JB92DRAFT_2040109 [Gautieria morchelliformis]
MPRGNVHMHSTPRLSALWLLSKLQGTSGSLRCNVYNSGFLSVASLSIHTPLPLLLSFFLLLASLPSPTAPASCQVAGTFIQRPVGRIRRWRHHCQWAGMFYTYTFWRGRARTDCCSSAILGIHASA